MELKVGMELIAFRPAQWSREVVSHSKVTVKSVLKNGNFRIEGPNNEQWKPGRTIDGKWYATPAQWKSYDHRRIVLDDADWAAQLAASTDKRDRANARLELRDLLNKDGGWDLETLAAVRLLLTTKEDVG